jgi:two-component system, NarL family, sensor histidine kinase DesK
VDADVGPASPAEAAWVASQRQWTQGWRRLALSALPLAYLIYVAGAVTAYSRGAAAAWGYAVLAAFGACWLVGPLVISPVASRETSQENSRRFWIFYGVLVALFGAELPFAHAAAFVLCVFITIAAPRRSSSRWPSARCWSR